MEHPILAKEYSEKLVHAATEFGINVVQGIAAETLKHKPGISLRDFIQILDTYSSQILDTYSDYLQQAENSTGSNTPS